MSVTVLRLTEMADRDLGTSFVQTLTAIKSKVDCFLKGVSNEDGAASLLNVEEEKWREILQRLEKTLDDLSELQKCSKVCIGIKFGSFVVLLDR